MVSKPSQDKLCHPSLGDQDYILDVQFWAYGSV